MLEPLFIKVIEVTRRFVFLQLIFGALGVRLVFHVVAIEEFVIEKMIVVASARRTPCVIARTSARRRRPAKTAS